MANERTKDDGRSTEDEQTTNKSRTDRHQTPDHRPPTPTHTNTQRTAESAVGWPFERKKQTVSESTRPPTSQPTHEPTSQPTNDTHTTPHHTVETNRSLSVSPSPFSPLRVFPHMTLSHAKRTFHSQNANYPSHDEEPRHVRVSASTYILSYLAVHESTTDNTDDVDVCVTNCSGQIKC